MPPHGNSGRILASTAILFTGATNLPQPLLRPSAGTGCRSRGKKGDIHLFRLRVAWLGAKPSASESTSWLSRTNPAWPPRGLRIALAHVELSLASCSSRPLPETTVAPTCGSDLFHLRRPAGERQLLRVGCLPCRRVGALLLAHGVVQASQGSQVGVGGREEALLRPGQGGLAVHDVGRGGIAVAIADPNQAQVFLGLDDGSPRQVDDVRWRPPRRGMPGSPGG